MVRCSQRIRHMRRLVICGFCQIVFASFFNCLKWRTRCGTAQKRVRSMTRRLDVVPCRARNEYCCISRWALRAQCGAGVASMSRSESGWCSDVASTHGAWRHAGVRFLLSGVCLQALSRFAPTQGKLVSEGPGAASSDCAFQQSWSAWGLGGARN